MQGSATSRWLLGLALLAVLSIPAGIFFSLNRVVKAAIETLGPKVAGTSVSVKSVHILPFSGSGRIRDLRIGNPPGFSGPQALRMKDIRVRLDLKSLRTDTIVVREIHIEGPEVDFETGARGSNLDRLRRNAEAFSSPPAKPSSRGAAKAEKKIVIERFTVKNGKVTLGTHLAKGKLLSVALPDIELKDIGKRSGGASIKDAAAQIFDSLGSSAARATTGLGGIQKAAQDTANSILHGIRSIFGEK